MTLLEMLEECDNYRPIYLINAVVKLYAKILAACLETVLGKLLHSDQTGFTKGRLSSDKIMLSVSPEGPSLRLDFSSLMLLCV